MYEYLMKHEYVSYHPSLLHHISLIEEVNLKNAVKYLSLYPNLNEALEDIKANDWPPKFIHCVTMALRNKIIENHLTS